MKKGILLVAVAFFYLSCNDNVVNEKKINEAGVELQKSVKKATDSAGAKLKRLKNKIKEDQAHTSHL